jgi:hypothetical protein
LEEGGEEGICQERQWGGEGVNGKEVEDEDEEEGDEGDIRQSVTPIQLH